MRLIGLQQRELGVVAEVDALVAKCPAQLEDPLDTADAQALEIQLRGDPQIQVEVVGVDVGQERPGVGAAVDLLQNRRLDLQKPLAEEGFADRMQNTAACPDQIAGLGVDRQVDVSGAYPCLLIGQPLPFVGQRAQAFADHPPAQHDQRPGALLAVAHRSGHLDQVTQIDGVREIHRRALFEQRIVQQQLNFPGPVAQLREQHATVVADAQYPPGHGHRARALGFDRGKDGVAGFLADGVGVDSAVLQRLELGHPDPDLFGQPRPFLLVQSDLQFVDIRGGAVMVQQATVDDALRHRGVMSGVRLLMPAGERQHQEAFRDHRGHADAGDQPCVLVARIARNPLGLILHVRAVQRLQLPPAGEEHQQGAPQPRDRTGAELGTLFERRAEHREVQRNTAHPNAFGLQAQFADHQFDGAVGGLRGAAHQIQRHPVGAPRHEGEHGDHLVPSRPRAATPRPAGSRRRPGRPVGPVPWRSRVRRRCRARHRPARSPWPSRRRRDRDACGSAPTRPRVAPGSPPAARHACRGPDSRKLSGYRIASSPSCKALRPAARNASAAVELAPITPGAQP